MNLSLIKAQILIIALLFSGLNAAQNADEFREKVLKAQKNQRIKLSTQTTNKYILRKGHVDADLAVKVFSWNDESVDNISLNKSQSLQGQYRQALESYFNKNAELHGANKWSINEARLTRLHDTGRGGLIAQFSQQINNIEVFGRSINILINRKNEYVASSGYFSPSTQTPKVAYVLSAREALQIGFRENTTEQISLLSMVKASNMPEFQTISEHSFSEHYRLSENSRVKKVFYPLTTEKLVPAFYIEVETSEIGDNHSRMFSYVIDGVSGKVLFKNNLSADVATTYKVFAENTANNVPFDGPQGNDLTPHPTGNINDTPSVGTTFVSPNTLTLDFGPISTGDPWLTENVTTTTGNNIDAYADISGEDGFDAEDVRPEMTSANAFEYDFATFADGLVGDAQKHAVVNLFYTNNFLHDWFYDNGFDESAGNAQQSNFGRGGSEGDPLKVEAQDFSGNNNANMSTPSDGSSPTMQMFVWTFLSDTRVEITGISNIVPRSAVFGPEDYDVTAVLSLVDDGIAPNGDACAAITTDLTGLIAIIDRGDCNFTVKVKNAQDKGAVAVLMVNNVTGNAIIMGGDDSTITIPSSMVTIDKGQEIKDALAIDSSLQARLFNLTKPLDGTLDNGIVAHEWAHYLSGRLVGNANGLTNNQGRSMGEGWSDFVALLMSVQPSDNLIAGNDNYQGVYSAATFVGDAYFGIRRVPYSTDMTKNALTFKHIEDGVALPTSHPVAFGASGSFNAEVHASGEVWAEVLWEVFVGLINKPTYSFEQAGEAMKDYLVAGMKMTPNAPTMLEARDAILSVVLANNVDDFLIVRDAFTRRGMGAVAIAPERNSNDHAGVVEDFSTAVDLQTAISVDKSSFDLASCDSDGVLDANETATVIMSFKNFAAGALPQFDVNLSSTADVSFSNAIVTVEPLAGFGDSISKSFDITLNSASFLQQIEITASIAQIGAAAADFTEPPSISTFITTHFDFTKNLHSDDMSAASASEFDWAVQADGQVSPFVIADGGWYGVDSGAGGASDLITPEIKVAASGDFTISFDHFYFFESSEDPQGVIANWDGGVIEVSVDGGDWIDVIDFGATLSEPYNGTLDIFNQILGGRQAYTATRDFNDFAMQGNVLTFAEGLVNGHNLHVRFRIGTDANTGDYGWLIDNVVVSNAIEPMFSEIVAENNVCLSGSAPVVNAGEDISIKVIDNSDITIGLSGTATDADGDALTIQWIQRLGPTVVVNNATALQAHFVIAAPTDNVDMVFDLVVNDAGHTRSDSINISLHQNNKPTVTATGSSVEEGTTATLSATASDDDGDSLTFSWTQTSGPNVTLLGADSADASFTAPVVSATTTLTFDVTANDGVDDSVAASATVTVTNKPTPPTNNNSGGGGGGGSIPLSLLVILSLLAGLSRYQKLTVSALSAN